MIIIENFPGIDGLVDMKLTYGTTVVEEKDRLARAGKVFFHFL